jgi:hypothetical protein
MINHLIEQINRHQQEAEKRFIDNVKHREKINKEKSIFKELQDMLFNPEKYPVSFEYKGYELDDRYIAGEFFVLLEGNLYEYDTEGNLKLIRRKEDKNQKDSGKDIKIT